MWGNVYYLRCCLLFILLVVHVGSPYIRTVTSDSQTVVLQVLCTQNDVRGQE